MIELNAPFATTRNGVPVVLTNFLFGPTDADIGRLVLSRLIGTGKTERFVDNSFDTTRLFLRMYRPQDVNAEGVITGRPYYGFVATQPHSNYFGPVTALPLINPPIVGADGTSVLPISTAEPGTDPVTYTNTLRTRTGYAWVIAPIFQERFGTLTVPGGPAPLPTENWYTGYQWSANICTGTWTVVADHSFTYQTESNTGVRTNHSVTYREIGNITVPAGWFFPCPGDPPGSPTVSSGSVTSSSAVISWTNSTPALVPNYWEYSTDNANWTRVAGDGTATSVIVTGLSANTQHTVYVRGVAGQGNGVAGTTTFRTSATTAAVVAPTVSFSNVDAVSATVNWVAGTGGTAVAKWQWSTDNSTWTDVPGGVNVISLLVENLEPATVYTYYIRGVSAGNVNGASSSTSFVTAAPPVAPDEPVLGAVEVQRSLIGALGGGSLKTTDRPPLIVVRSDRPAVVWDISPFIVPAPTIYPGATLPGTEDSRAYADEFDPLPLKWSYFSLPNSPQSSVRVLLNVYDTAGNLVSGGARTLQVVNNVATFTTTGTRVTTELNQFDVAGNTTGRQAASQGAPNGWGATPAGDSVGFARVGLQLTAQDSAIPTARSSSAALLDVVPYQGLRLGDISTYNAGAGLVGFECHYYARGITATSQARNNEVAYYKWAIYRRNAPENERPVAGTIREAGQTLTATGAHWVPTGWSVGYSQQAWQTARGQVPLVRSGFRNPDPTRLRIAFPSAETTGLLPNGNYTVRLRVIDIYGNQVGPQALNFSVNRAGGTTTPVSTTLPPGADAQTIAIVPAPRVYTADGTLTTTANTGLASVTSGLIPGQSIGLSVNVVGTVPSRDDLRDVIGSEGEVVNILVVQRREFSRISGRDVDRSPRIVGGRIFINQIAGSAGAYYPTFRVLNDDGGVDAIFFDHQLESGVEYQYRCVWINKFSNRSYSTWVPA